MPLCKCNVGIGNMGVPNCDQIFGAVKKFIYVPQYTAAGVENKVNPATTLNLAWATALINNSDKSVRFFFTPALKNVKMVKDAPVMESFEDGASNFIAESLRKVSAILPEVSPRLKANFEQVRCNANTMAYGVDLEGNLIGCTKYGDGLLYPFPINPKSLYAGVAMAEDGASQQIGLSFEIPKAFDDSTLVMIAATAFTDFNLNNIAGLLDGNVSFSASGASTTVIVATITTPGADLFAPIRVEGLLIGNFVSSVTGVAGQLRNTTNGLDVAITTVVENTPGVYTITFPIQTTKNIVALAKLNGYDFVNMRSKSFVTL